MVQCVKSFKIPMESGQRNHDDNFKLQIYLKITQLQLEVDDSGNISQSSVQSLYVMYRKTVIDSSL